MNLFVIAAVVLTCLAVALVITPLLRKTDGMPASPVAAIVLGLALPASVLLIYLFVSNHDWSAPVVSADNSGAGSRSAGGGLASIDEMVVSLEKRLQAEPGDVTGWLLLGRTYAQLQRIPESAQAYRQALTLEPSSEAKLGVAEAEILMNRESLMGDAGQLVEEVLVVEPDNPKALFYGGMVAMVHQDVDTFRDRWQRLLTLSPPDDIRAVIEAELAKVGAAAEQVGAKEPGPTTAGVNVNILVSSDLAEHIKPAAVLYLLARDPVRPGPPLAVIRQDASILPAMLNISDSNAMTPGTSLTSLSQVKLIARITNSGEPVAQAGDLFGEVIWNPDEEAGKDISIVIDRIVD